MRPKSIDGVQQAIDAILAMRVAGLKDYGQFPTKDAEVLLKAQVYAGTVERLGVPVAFIPVAGVWCVDHMTDFPSASKFADVALKLYDESTEAVALGELNGR